MDFPSVTLADWRAQVDRELAGKSFEKALVQETLEGVSILPLYTEVPAGAALTRDPTPGPFRICMRPAPSASSTELLEEVTGGAEALWLSMEHVPAEVLARPELAGTFFVVDVDAGSTVEAIGQVLARLPAAARSNVALNLDPVGGLARGSLSAPALKDALPKLGPVARSFEDRGPGATSVTVSTLPYHDAGADAVDELAYALATGAVYLEALLDARLKPEQAARQVSLQIAVGRDTFLELCKVRALRTCWRKLLAAAGAPDAARTRIHAVCSSRTLAARDPWVNMLRVTTQMFSAILGGADLVTPMTFDAALGIPSAHGRRVARNTGLVLREESLLGKVADPAGGAYFFETLTDAIARQAWARFQTIEREGGIIAALTSGRVATHLDSVWRERLQSVAKRKTPILGVSEFANLDEKLPPSSAPASGSALRTEGLLAHRDSEAFEALRSLVGGFPKAPEAVLVALGPLAESRPRVGFAAGFFTAGGIRTREVSVDEPAPIACLCGSDERYAEEAAARARALKAAGCGRVLLAGRPGAMEKSLREAGVDGFIFTGSDVVATLSELLDLRS